MVASELKPTKAGTGQYMRVQFAVGPDKLSISSFFNVENQSAKAQQIGRGQFKALLTALGITKSLNLPEDFEKLAHFKTLYVLVAQEEREGKVRNVISRFINKKDVVGKAAQAEDDQTIPF